MTAPLPCAYKILGLGLIALAAWRSPTLAVERPNVLFVAVDDLNDWIQPLGGHPQATTPHIARLCAQGMLFERAYCPAPACNPSRTAVMTGIRPTTSGVYHNEDPWRAALPDAVTLPQHFRAHGYRALGAGKIFHDAFPDPPSWNQFFPSLDRQRPADPLPTGRPLNGLRRTAHFDWGSLPVADSQMGDAQVVDWVIDQLTRPQDRPFFLACGLYRPHLPWYAPQQYFNRFPLAEIQLPLTRADDLADVPPAGVAMANPEGDHRRVVQSDQWRQAVQGYLASIAFADAQIGRLLEALARSPARERTIVVFWTDHGWHLGEKQHWRKFALWEEATRTPLAILGPGIRPGRCSRPVNLIDVYPTLIELCGLAELPAAEGQSLAPLLENPQASWDRPSLTTHGRGNHAVRSERYRYIRYADGSEELYDHSVDPQEWDNRSGDPALASVKAELARWLPPAEASPGLLRGSSSGGSGTKSP